jgi:phosphoserine phosphatase
MLRIALRLGADLDAAFSQINDQLEQDLAANRFVTAFLGQLDARTHQVSYHAGGQGPILYFRAASGECEWHNATTAPMGFMPIETLKPPRVVELAPGDILGLITDGVFEYEDDAGEQFGTSRAEQLFRQHHDRPMAQLVELLLQAVQEYGGAVRQADDITIVLIRRLPD